MEPLMIGILYESNEWSDHKLAAELRSLGHEVCLFNLENDPPTADILACDLVVSRVFASAGFRAHHKSLQRMPGLLATLEAQRVPLLNSVPAHRYETSKALCAAALKNAGFPAPVLYASGTPDGLRACGLPFPCIIKPDCGGRTTHTAIVRDAAQLDRFLASVPPLTFIAEEYREPVRAYLTRIEVLGDTCVLVLKRGIAPNGLSAYHLGVSYEHYDDCPQEVLDTALAACRLLSIEMGSLDIIEGIHTFSIIDVNAVSNVSEDNTALFGLDLMHEYARYIAGRYKEMVKGA
jgi:ribosomal protein S6--L-glutamate ligase